MLRYISLYNRKYTTRRSLGVSNRENVKYEISNEGSFADLTQIAFGRRGSYLTFYLDDYSDGSYGHTLLYLGNCNGFASIANRKKLISLHVVHKGVEVPYSVKTTPATLRMQSMYGYVEFCISETNLIRIKGEGVSLLLKAELPGHESIKPREPGCYEINFSAISSKLLLMPVRGRLEAEMPYNYRLFGCPGMRATFVPEEGEDEFEGAILEYMANGKKREAFPSYESCVNEVMGDFEAWKSKLPDVPEAYQDIADKAAYAIWSNVMPPFGTIKAEMVFMDRNHFASAFAWQQSYQAVVHSRDIQVAWDLLLSMFTLQEGCGQIPDSTNGANAFYSSVKPPFQGFALDWIMNRCDIGVVPIQKCEKLYDHLTKWTQWWFDYRDLNRDGIPAYDHGDECGGDDVSLFCEGIPVAAPDLVAFLTLQMDVLGRLAERLGKTQERQYWEGRSKEMLQILIERFWNGERFVAYQGFDMEKEVKTDALNYYLPLMLGERLPQEIREKMIADLSEEGRFLTSYGLATEALDSPQVEYSYAWTRGTINAPNQFMMTVALANSGAEELAAKVAGRYCAIVSEYGPHQHFNPRTGKPVDHFGFTKSAFSNWTSWGAATFFLLAAYYTGESC